MCTGEKENMWTVFSKIFQTKQNSLLQVYTKQTNAQKRDSVFDGGAHFFFRILGDCKFLEHIHFISNFGVWFVGLSLVLRSIATCMKISVVKYMLHIDWIYCLKILNVCLVSETVENARSSWSRVVFGFYFIFRSQ